MILRVLLSQKYCLPPRERRDRDPAGSGPEGLGGVIVEPAFKSRGCGRWRTNRVSTQLVVLVLLSRKYALPLGARRISHPAASGLPTERPRGTSSTRPAEAIV
jgi:hypothetical protein